MKNKTIHFLNSSYSRTKALIFGAILLSTINLVQAQCTIGNTYIPVNVPTVVNGVTVSRTATGNIDNQPSLLTQTNNCSNSRSIAAGTIYVLRTDNAAAQGNTATVTFTFDKPVNNVIIRSTQMHAEYSPAESMTITANNGTVSTTSIYTCLVAKSGNTYTSTNPYMFQYGGDAVVQITSTQPYTSITISASSYVTASAGNGGFYIDVCRDSITESCTAGTTAPPMNATTLSNVCSATTVNLNSLHSGTAPIGSNIVWFDNNTHTGTAIANPTAVTASGTYYAFYYNSAVGGCYSPVSNPVTVNIINCCAAGINPPVVNGTGN